MTFEERYSQLFQIVTENFQIDLDQAYELFSQEYLKTTGQTWSKDKFLSRARNWTFYGDDNGYVSVRKQNSGFVKLVGAAGNNKSKYLGFKQLIASGQPVWGMVSDDIKNMLLKMGFKMPNFIEKQFLKKLIDTNVLGDAKFERFEKDGGVTITYPDVGTVTKYFVGSPSYWKKLYASPMNAAKEKLKSFTTGQSPSQ